MKTARKFADDQFAMTFVGYRIVEKPYAMVRDIMSEFDESEHILRRALKEGHGIEIDDAPGAVNMLYFVVDQEMCNKLREHRIDHPTLLQLLGCSRVISNTAKDAEERFAAMMHGDN